MTPEISVIMPAYNAEFFISEAIESILNQSFKNFEFIIIDDFSKDHTLEVINKYAFQDPRIKVIKNSHNLKLATSLNIGINASSGKYIARMDADDVALTDRLKKQFDFMESNPDVGISGGSMDIINEAGKKIGYRRYSTSDNQLRHKIFRYSPFSHPLVIIRKDILLKAGLYIPEWNPAEDYELYFRVGSISHFANLEDTLLKYRVVTGSMTTKSVKRMEDITFKIRRLYKNKNGYVFNIVDLIYNILQYLSMFFMPPGFRIKFFVLLRALNII